MNTTASTSGAAGAAAPPGNEEKTKSHKPKYTRFSQQELWACKPLMTPGHVMAVFMLIGAIFIPIGAVTLLASHSVVEVVYQYESECLSASAMQQGKSLDTKAQRISFIQDPSTPKNCTVNLTIPRAMAQPIYVYYELSNFYQNHRRYVKSRSDSQLQGNAVSDKELAACAPEDYAGGQPIVPCGLVAWSLFNDSYVFSRSNSSLPVNRIGIAWKSDLSKYGASVRPSNFQNNNSSAGYVGGGQLPEGVPLNQNEDLLVWMRVAALPTFRKLWGRIEQDLSADDTLTVSIQNLYNTFSFDGSKKLVLSTTSWIGGKNDFLGGAYLAVGGVSVTLAFAFFLMYYFNPRALGDTTYFTWNQKGAGQQETL